MFKGISKLMARSKKPTVPAPYVPAPAVSVFYPMDEAYVARCKETAVALRQVPRIEHRLFVPARNWTKPGTPEYAHFSDYLGNPEPVVLKFTYDETLKCGACHDVDGFVAQHGAKEGMFSLTPPKAAKTKGVRK
jgi:hypothetical protein